MGLDHVVVQWKRSFPSGERIVHTWGLSRKHGEIGSTWNVLPWDSPWSSLGWVNAGLTSRLDE